MADNDREDLTMVEALGLIAKIADQTLETDPALRTNAARQFRRIADLSDRAILALNMENHPMTKIETEFADLIGEILEDPDTDLSANALNTLNMTRPGHPAGVGKETVERIREAIWAVAGRKVYGGFRMRLGRLYVRALKAGEA